MALTGLATLAGTIGLMFLFIRLLPMISMFELKMLIPRSHTNQQEA